MARTKQTAKKSIGPMPMQNHEITREDNIEERVRVLEKKIDWAIKEMEHNNNIRECLDLCKLVKKCTETIPLIKNLEDF